MLIKEVDVAAKTYAETERFLNALTRIAAQYYIVRCPQCLVVFFIWECSLKEFKEFPR